ncbi:MAG TPA: hypothetical protein VL943_03570, partial [Niabella sp.]|nr:hypothetical protein [Niabella sp.]
MGFTTARLPPCMSHSYNFNSIDCHFVRNYYALVLKCPVGTGIIPLIPIWFVPLWQTRQLICFLCNFMKKIVSVFGRTLIYVFI